MIDALFGPLRRRLILLFAIVLLVPSAFGTWAAIDKYRGEVKLAQESMLRYAQLASNYEANLLWQSQQIAQNLSRDEDALLALRGSENPQIHTACGEAFARAVKPYPSYGTAILFDLAGDPTCQWDESKQINNVADRDWFKAMKTTKTAALSGYAVSRLLNEPIIAYFAPVFDHDGSLKGAIVLGIRLNWLAAIGQEPGLPSEGEVTLLDRDGHVLVSSIGDSDRAAKALPIKETVAGILTGGIRTLETTGMDGLARLYAVNALGNDGLFVVFSMPRAALLDPLLRDLMIQIGILCLVSVAGMLAALFGARLLVTRWTEKLTDVAGSMGLGRLSPETDLRGAPDELRQLGENLKAMSVRVEHREADLRESLAQKQLMLREIHHRVKNNLQIVTSLLNLYARLPRGDAFKQAFADLQMRINALALVHRHLYESEDLKEIDLAPFMRNLCSLLQDGSGVSARRVRLNCTFPQLRLVGDRAVPLALLTTEILTNCFKHAFPNLRSGTIDVTLTVAADGTAHFTIVDDGVGPTAGAEDATLSMGSTLMKAFAKQLGGELEISGPPGTRTTIAFNVLPLMPGG